jgi:hypothetical protein
VDKVIRTPILQTKGIPITGKPTSVQASPQYIAEMERIRRDIEPLWYTDPEPGWIKAAGQEMGWTHWYQDETGKLHWREGKNAKAPPAGLPPHLVAVETSEGPGFRLEHEAVEVQIEPPKEKAPWD